MADKNPCLMIFLGGFNCEVRVIFLDISKAFDKVCHQLVKAFDNVCHQGVLKPKYNGISGNFLKIV